MEMHIGLSQDKAVYHNQRVKTAIVLINGAKFNLAVSDTTRCAMDAGAAKRTLKNLAARAGSPEWEPGENEGAKLHEHCRVLIGLKKPKE